MADKKKKYVENTTNNLRYTNVILLKSILLFCHNFENND